VSGARNDQLIGAASTVLQGVTYDAATVTAAIVGIINAVTHQDLTLIRGPDTNSTG
jgi:hypothetical protein